ncbi:hypothetical protein GCM10010517_02660 [Streptosporangium fragile]|uniref:Peptidase n=1 Tax=Streptosporangium fragile TaxID=46186 RepID=A0ABP6I5B8_9ACTN
MTPSPTRPEASSTPTAELPSATPAPSDDPVTPEPSPEETGPPGLTKTPPGHDPDKNTGPKK